jgi:ProP effector
LPSIPKITGAITPRAQRTPRHMDIDHPDFRCKPPVPIGQRNKPDATIALLAARFPDTFATELAKVRPLAVGIFHTLQLRCPDISPMQLRAALRAYCRHGAYLRSLVEGAARIDLDGSPPVDGEATGCVTADAAQHAAARIAAREAAAIKQAAEAKAAFAAKPGSRIKPVNNGTTRPQKPPRQAPQVHDAGPRRLGLAGLKAAALARRGGAP